MADRSDYTHKIVNGVKVDLTEAEIDALMESKVAWENNKAAQAWGDLRARRNGKLTESDWMANSDVTMSDAWKTYRQKLRDLPSTLNDTTVQETITWPEEPS